MYILHNMQDNRLERLMLQRSLHLLLEHEPAVKQYFGSEFGNLYVVSSQVHMRTEVVENSLVLVSLPVWQSKKIENHFK